MIRLSPHGRSMPAKVGWQLGLWVLSVAIGVVFLLAGSAKLGMAQPMVDAFASWGYPRWFMIAIGLVEVIAAALLVVPRTALQAAVALSIVMVGAFTTHLIHAETSWALVPLVMFGLLAILIAGHRILRHK